MSLRLEFLVGYSCNLSCDFCMESSRLEGVVEAPVPLADIVRTLAVQRRRGAGFVSFCGAGEPTLHPQLPQALRAAKKLGYETEVISNGSRLADPGYAARVLPWIDRLWLSLHGDEPALHDGLTGQAGSFARLERAFALARRRRGLFLGSVTVVTRANQGRVPQIMRRALDEGARACQLAQVTPTGRAENDYARHAVPYSWWRRAVPELAGIAKSAGASLLCSGVPLCALGSRWRLSRERSLAPTVSVERVREGGRAALRAEDLLPLVDGASRRVKPRACRGCAKRAGCLGVPERHVEAFGEGDLVAYGGAPRTPRAEAHERGDRTESVLRITSACNQRCPFCFIDADGWNAGLDGLEAELDRLAPELGGDALALSGGEPLAHPRLFDILESARRRGIRRFTVQTNGVALAKPGMLEKLVELGVEGFDVSFHAHRAPLYDRLSGTRGQHPRAVSALARLLAGHRGYVSVCVVINALNYRHLPAWAGFLGKMARAARRDARAPLRVAFTMLNGIGLDRAPDLAVDLARVKPYLRRALARCSREALVVERSAGECDMPPCLTEAPGKFASESALPQDRVLYSDDFAAEPARGGRAKRLSCRGCRYDARCLGVPAEYARAFGLGALHAS